MRVSLLLVVLILAVGCGGRGAATECIVAQEKSLNIDSLLGVMDVRYNQLCAERKAAYSERDPELRQQLLERNDARCRALDDSLKWAMSLCER